MIINDHKNYDGKTKETELCFMSMARVMRFRQCAVIPFLSTPTNRKKNFLSFRINSNININRLLCFVIPNEHKTHIF